MTEERRPIRKMQMVSRMGYGGGIGAKGFDWVAGARRLIYLLILNLGDIMRECLKLNDLGRV